MGESCCEVDLHAVRSEQRRVLKVVLSINIATFVMVVAAAWYSGSSSLLSGGLDNFGDALTYALSLAVVGGSQRAKSRVALLKSALILGAAAAVAARIAWGIANPNVPIVEAMSAAALLNLGANLVCLRLLTPYRHGDINMSSAWECSRNDIYEGLAVLAASATVWFFDSSWPDLVIACALLFLFLRSGVKVFRASFRSYLDATS